MPKPIITIVGSFAVGMTLRTSRMPIFGEPFCYAKASCNRVLLFTYCHNMNLSI